MNAARAEAGAELAGFRIGVTSDRRSEDLIDAFVRRGAEVLHAPALKLAANDRDGELLAETQAVIDAEPDITLVTTGYGLRRWVTAAEHAGLAADLVRVLAGSRMIARGPKALGAIRALELGEGELSAAETTASLVDRVVDRVDEEGARNGGDLPRVAIQLHGYHDPGQLERLREVSAELVTVTPYRWTRPEDSEQLPGLLREVLAGRIDAVTFTSAPAVDATLVTARSLGCYDELLAAFGGGVIAAVVGPVTGGPLTDAGVPVLQPDRHRMGALIKIVVAELILRRRPGETAERRRSWS